MVARIDTTADISRLLKYNEEKVTQGKAECIHQNNFLQKKKDITYDEKFERFQRLNELNTRAQDKMLHATLNFKPGEKLSNGELSAIADRYMEGLQMKDQPYLVYRHDDARHPHIHIVSSIVREDGKCIDTRRIGARLSEPIRKAIEKEFQLLPNLRVKNAPVPGPDEIQRITPNNDLPISESMNRIIGCVNKHYHFTDLHEYNAILRGYNITAETGSPGSKTHQHQGIYYLALDDKGNKISPPVMASDLPCRPTLARLNEKFHHSHANQLDNQSSIRQRIDWALDWQPANLGALVSHLHSDGIEIVRPPLNGRNPHDQIFVDHTSHTAVSGKTLGPNYTTDAFDKTFAERHRPGKRKQLTEKSQDIAPFNANVPQVLSGLFNTEPTRPDIDVFRKDQHLGQRRSI